MYAQLRQGLPAAASATGLRLRLASGVSRNVVYLGLTSLLTDISSEMVSTILPLYLVFFLKFTPLQFGMLDGLYQGGAALIRLVGAAAADRSYRYKEVAGLGYGLSAVSKIGLLLGAAGGPGLVAASLFVDRTGKGIRTAPRDALISLSSESRTLGTSFAVHRTLDTCGAMIGPLVGFAVLALLPNGFDVVFVASLCFALIGLGVLTLFVENRRPTEHPLESPRRVPYSVLWQHPRFKFLVLAAAALGLATMSDAFLYLTLQHKLTFAATFIPLLYVGTSLVYFVLALPAGRLADRIGRGRVFVAGYTLLLAIYLVLMVPALDAFALVLCLLLFGAYYAATDGVLMAFASSMLPPELRTTGLAVLTGATGTAALVASLAFGALWTVWGPDAAVAVFCGGLVLAILLTVFALWRTRAPATTTSPAHA